MMVEIELIPNIPKHEVPGIAELAFIYLLHTERTALNAANMLGDF